LLVGNAGTFGEQINDEEAGKWMSSARALRVLPFLGEDPWCLGR
jgi:hypothetical protein